MEWIAIKDKEPEWNIEVLGYSPEWIDEDFNPDGIRVFFINGDGVHISAGWCSCDDVYTTEDTELATHWMKKPEFIKNRK